MYRVSVQESEVKSPSRSRGFQRFTASLVLGLSLACSRAQIHGRSWHDAIDCCLCCNGRGQQGATRLEAPNRFRPTAKRVGL